VQKPASAGFCFQCSEQLNHLTTCPTQRHLNPDLLPKINTMNLENKLSKQASKAAMEVAAKILAKQAQKLADQKKTDAQRPTPNVTP
jgi:hypothetical protein